MRHTAAGGCITSTPSQRVLHVPACRTAIHRHQVKPQAPTSSQTTCSLRKGSGSCQSCSAPCSHKQSQRPLMLRPLRVTNTNQVSVSWPKTMPRLSQLRSINQGENNPHFRLQWQAIAHRSRNVPGADDDAAVSHCQTMQEIWDAMGQDANADEAIIEYPNYQVSGTVPPLASGLFLGLPIWRSSSQLQLY